MPDEIPDKSVFEKTYFLYLRQVSSKITHLPAERLGISILDDEIGIDMLNSSYTVLKDGIFDSSVKTPSFEVCVIILKYLLAERDGYPQDESWSAYRDLRDSKPLIAYFKANVEGAFVKEFSGSIDRLKKSCNFLGGRSLKDQFNRDIAVQFDILPRVPALLLFNDEDNEFSASCSVLFERRAEKYLDAECLAMAGRVLFEFLLENSN